MGLALAEHVDVSEEVGFEEAERKDVEPGKRELEGVELELELEEVEPELFRRVLECRRVHACTRSVEWGFPCQYYSYHSC